VRSSRRLTEAEPRTAVDRDALTKLNGALLDVPDGFTVNRKLRKAFDRRRDAFGDPDFRLDWAHAEQLAIATLLTEGVPVRLTGQDTERGTFSHRHAVLHDAETGDRYVPLQHVPGQQAAFEVHSSPLSEYACLGFEYGYAVAVPHGLVLWEAQFGDFINGGQIVVDQFIVAGYAKWGQTSRLTLLLPHGYEGQGPEHSSARLERFLALAAEHNIRVANCSTPAQYYHLLRRQALHEDLRPLIVMTPKSLLRLPAAASALEEFSEGRFQPVIDDADLPGTREDVRRLVFCSGKLYYDLVESDPRTPAKHVALARIELLYPFPSTAVLDVIEAYPMVKEIVWAQEEPQNLGARKWSVPRIGDVAPSGVPVRYISRPERASPAEGYPKAHQEQQQRIIDDVFAD
jgi:2-oxoglutarate dehydrogenase E1 component